MTAQWQHRYISEEGEVILSEKTPFVPEKYGISPQGSFTTQCRRGYVCEFQIKEQSCVLNRLLISMQPLLMDRGQVPLEEYPPLNGRRPRAFYITSNRWVALYDEIGLIFELDSPLQSSFDLPDGLSQEERKARKSQLFRRYSPRNPFEEKDDQKISRTTANKIMYTDPRTELPLRHDTEKKEAGSNSMTTFQDTVTMGYDIIGDIHGHADELESLLEKIGYSSDGTRHPKRRRLIFLGDFIDRGPKNRRVVEIIRTLIRADMAFAVMGNHEYNAICYHTKAESDDSQYLRQHSEKNRNQHHAFLDEYPDIEERSQVVRWFQRLPLFLDLDDLRIVHACWDQEAVEFVEDRYENTLTKEFLQRSVDRGSQEHAVIETLLKGPERSLRAGLTFPDCDGNARTDFRLKWWKEELFTLDDAAILPPGVLAEYRTESLSEHCGEQSVSPYPTTAPPVVFGHYAALSTEESFSSNAACLDYNIIGGESLACLRWNKAEKGKKALAEMEIVKVSSQLRKNLV